MKKFCLSVLMIYILSLLHVSCAQDTSNLFLNSPLEISDSPRITVTLKTLNETDKKYIFSLAKEMVFEIAGFLLPSRTETKSIINISGSYLINPLSVFPQKTYTITKAYLIDENKSIIAVCPYVGSILADYANPLPLTITSRNAGNTNAELLLLPATDGTLELTGYDFSSNGTLTLPSVKFELKVRDGDNYQVTIPSKLTVRRKSNNAPIFPQLTSSSGSFPLEFHYFDETEVFIFEVEGINSAGKIIKTKDEKTAKLIFSGYDRRQNPLNGDYNIILREN